MLDEEIAHARNGEEAYAGFKLNSLTDKKIIDKLIEASEAGVKIDMIIRGICCLIPGVEGKTEKHPYHQHCRKIPGTFQNLYLRKQRKKEILHCICRFHDQKYCTTCRGCCTGI